MDSASFVAYTPSGPFSVPQRRQEYDGSSKRFLAQGEMALMGNANSTSTSTSKSLGGIGIDSKASQITIQKSIFC